jgi:4-amino-4-deoxy-L-arabinose transferase-like glycosyltransferase
MPARIGLTRWLPCLAVVIAAAAVYLYSLADTPIYLGGDEAHSAVEAYSIATTARDHNGTFLPLFVNVENPLAERHDGDRWWQPLFIYLQAAALTVLPLAEWSVRLPSVLLALVNVALAYAIAARLFGGVWFPVASALMLAMTPVHLIFGRMALDYFAPVTFTLAWLYCLVVFLETGALAAMACGGLILGLGVYSHISAWVFMPLFVVLTWLAVVWTRQRAVAAVLVVTVAFAVPLIPFVLWTRTHPEMLAALAGSYQSPFMAKLTFLQKARELLNYTNIQDKVGIYWNFFNPSFLFLAGGSNLSLSTRTVGVFLLPFSVLLVAGIRDVFTNARTRPLGTVLTLGLLAAPIPAVLRGESQAIQRELVIVPFAVLIALFGLAALARHRSSLVRAAAIVMLAAMPLQFAFFAKDYFGDYQKRSAYWFDPVAFRDVASELLALDGRSGLPAIYLSSDLDDGSTRWLFYLWKHRREDLWARTHEVDPAHLQEAGLAPGAVLVLYANGAVRA